MLIIIIMTMFLLLLVVFCFVFFSEDNPGTLLRAVFCRHLAIKVQTNLNFNVMMTQEGKGSASRCCVNVNRLF